MLPRSLEDWADKEWDQLKIMRKVWTWKDGVHSLYEKLTKSIPRLEEVQTIEEARAYCAARDATIAHYQEIVKELNQRVSDLAELVEPSYN